MKVRPYRSGIDFALAVLLGGEMHAESPHYRDKPFSLERLQELDQLLGASADFLALLAEHDGEVAGLFVGGVAHEFFSDARYGFDLALYVRQQYRGSSAALRLVSTFLGWAKVRGAGEVRLGITTGVHEERTARLFAKLGFSNTGQLYRLAV